MQPLWHQQNHNHDVLMQGGGHDKQSFINGLNSGDGSVFDTMIQGIKLSHFMFINYRGTLNCIVGGRRRSSSSITRFVHPRQNPEELLHRNSCRLPYATAIVASSFHASSSKCGHKYPPAETVSKGKWHLFLPGKLRLIGKWWWWWLHT